MHCAINLSLLLVFSSQILYSSQLWPFGSIHGIIIWFHILILVQFFAYLSQVPSVSYYTAKSESRTQTRLRFVCHFLLLGKNVAFLQPLENFQIRQTMYDTLIVCIVTFSNMAMGYSRKNAHTPNRWQAFLTPPSDWISQTARAPLPPGFPSSRTPPILIRFPFFLKAVTGNNRQ